MQEEKDTFKLNKINFSTCARLTSIADFANYHVQQFENFHLKVRYPFF